MQDDQYERESQCQDYVDYGPEGYHPVVIGEKFNGKYIVQQKLGWGHFSTVWLVYNQQQNQYSALKIQRSKDNHAQSALDELQMLKKIKEHEKDQGWIQFVQNMAKQHPNLISAKLCKPLELVDSFAHFGIHGKHYCTVFQLMGPNLLDLIQHYEFKDERMPLWQLKKITIDVLMGLVHLHEYAGLIHTDLKPENIMMKLHPEQQKQLIQKLKLYKVKPISMKYLKNLQTSKNSKNKKKKLKRKKKKQQGEQGEQGQQGQDNNLEKQQNNNDLDNQAQSSQNPSKSMANSEQKIQNSDIPQLLPQQSTQKKSKIQQQQLQKEQNLIKQEQKLDMSVLRWKNVNIKLNTSVFYKIADMGNACYIKKHFTQNIQTRQYRSPQVILGHDYLPNTDLWSLACTVYQMMTNSFLFKPKVMEGISKDEDHIYKMMEVLGEFKKEFALGGTESSRVFNKKGKLLHGNPKKTLSIKQLLHQDYGYSQEQAAQAQQFLKPMLQIDPTLRVNAREMLNHPWLWK